MNTNVKNALVIGAEMVGEFAIGLAAGMVLGDVSTRCNKVEKILLYTGGTIATIAGGRAFGKGVCNFANEHLGTNIDVM
jgi:hypothetical protein